MLTRREFFAVAAATATVTGLGDRLGQAAASRNITQDDLLRFTPKGQITLLHMTDCHAQLMPIFYREPSINLGVGDSRGQAPHITGREFLTKFGIEPGSHSAYALSAADFVSLARKYGKVGGMDRMATLVKAIRAERGDDKVLFLDGGDTLQGSYTALETKGADMVKVLNQLRVEATTGHWEFTYGTDRVLEFAGDKEKKGELNATFLAGNIVDNEWEESVFKATQMFTRNGVRIAVIGQAFPFTPIANPRYLMPKWSFGIRENLVRKRVAEARGAGAELVVLLSHNGLDTDRKLAARVDGIDVILTAHTHDSLPRPIRAKNTLIIASGSSTKFLSRLDIEMKAGRMAGFNYALIPVLSDAIAPDPDMAALVSEIRDPHRGMLDTALAKTESLLYRRGNFNGTFDDLICRAMLQERDAEIAFSPGFRWGASLLPSQDITWDDLYSQTAITYPACWRLKFKGEMIKNILEDVADNLFNPDPYYQQGGDMVRVGGMSYRIRVDGKLGGRISDMTLLRTGEPIAPDREYTVAGWASVNEGAEGPPVWDVVAKYLQDKKTVKVEPNTAVKVVREGL